MQTDDSSEAKELEPHIRWPEGKRFAFTIFDDTDFSTTDNVRPIYSLLRELGFRITKSVWPLGDPLQGAGQTCADPEYAAFACELQRAGFEIGMHGATPQTSDRALILAALERFKGLFGQYPATLAQHGNCAENVYWADARVSGARRSIYRVMRAGAAYRAEGNVEASPFFWGDLCRHKIKYVRNFVFRDINTLKLCPEMPYHDPQRPYVNFWFASSDGYNPRAFLSLISERNQRRLEQEGGACIVYTHFFSFSQNGRVLPEVQHSLERLAAKDGWFVPVGTLLDFLFAHKREHVLTDAQRRRLERRWLADVTLTHLAHIICDRAPAVVRRRFAGAKQHDSEC